MTGFTTKVRHIVYERAGQCCELCGVYAYGGSLHHRRPRGMGGDKRPEINAASNAVLLCGSGVTGCHGWVESNRSTAFDHHLLLEYREHPAETPVLLDRGWTLLDDTGLYLPVAA